MGQCETCKWAVALPDAGQEPQDPRLTKPNWLDRMFGSPYIFSLHYDWVLRDYRHRELISCHRYPRRTNMIKTETCGEFTPPTQDAVERMME